MSRSRFCFVFAALLRKLSSLLCSGVSVTFGAAPHRRIVGNKAQSKSAAKKNVSKYKTTKQTQSTVSVYDRISMFSKKVSKQKRVKVIMCVGARHTADHLELSFEFDRPAVAFFSAFTRSPRVRYAYPLVEKGVKGGITCPRLRLRLRLTPSCSRSCCASGASGTWGSTRCSSRCSCTSCRTCCASSTCSSCRCRASGTCSSTRCSSSCSGCIEHGAATQRVRLLSSSWCCMLFELWGGMGGWKEVGETRVSVLTGGGGCVCGEGGDTSDGRYSVGKCVENKSVAVFAANERDSWYQHGQSCNLCPVRFATSFRCHLRFRFPP